MSNPSSARRRATRLSALWLAIASVLLAARAHAAPLSAPSLHWVHGRGADTCAEARALAERVEALIGVPLARAAEAEHTIEGISERSSTGFQVRLRLFARGGRQLGERSLETRGDCAALTGPVAFVVAMMIDPEVVAHGLPPELMALLGEDAPEEQLLAELAREASPPVTAARDSPPPLPPPPAPEERTTAPAPVARFQLMLGAGGALFAGPEPAPVGQLWGAAYLSSWLSLAASVWGGAQLGAERAGAGSYRLGMAGFSALVCAASNSARRVQLASCLGPGLRLRHARGEGFGRDQSTSLLSGSAAALLRGRLRLRAGWGLGALVCLDIGFNRPRLSYTNAEGSRSVAHRFGYANLIVSLGPTYEF